MLPYVVHESLIRIFSFYADGTICQGMSYAGKLYRKVKSFNVHDRSSAFSLGCVLTQREYDIVLTASDRQYTVWIDLRTGREQLTSPQARNHKPQNASKTPPFVSSCDHP